MIFQFVRRFVALQSVHTVEHTPRPSDLETHPKVSVILLEEVLHCDNHDKQLHGVWVIKMPIARGIKRLPPG
ncbi:MAG: hypothetical protein JWO80_5372 [Bryobacterales bacterium]|nr:hypothetical protein [Bryobacterales bacterium]